MLVLEKQSIQKNLIESRLFSRGRGKTEWPTHGLREPRLEAYLGPAPVVERRFREDRPGSFCKLARGPMEPSGNGRSSSLISQGLDSSMRALRHKSGLARSTKEGTGAYPRLALAARGAVLVNAEREAGKVFNMLA